MNRSGRAIGEEYVERLRTYLDSVDALPTRGGKVHVSAIAEAAGVDRQSLYKNPKARELMDAAVATKGLKGIELRDSQDNVKVTRLELKINELEQKNATLLAENWELRRELSRLRHVERLMEQGKRVVL